MAENRIFMCNGSEFSVLYYDVIDSTNLEAKRLIKSGAKLPLIITADTQTAGKGRMGRQFYSPDKTGLYMSFVYEPETDFQDSVTVTSAAAVAVVRAIRELTDLNPKIKWVNDIYVDRKKVCGILAEGIFSQTEGKIKQIILGIGVNLFEPKAGFPKEISDIATSLYGKNAENPTDVKHQFVEKLLENLKKVLYSVDKNQVMEEYKNRSLILGEEVTVITPQKQYAALVKDITKKGHLIVEYEENDEIQQTELLSGEVSLRV
jgi:BirA family biotin operon repressor/biotin-[acetyl-CoA-carboxylase] ligase